MTKNSSVRDIAVSGFNLAKRRMHSLSIKSRTRPSRQRRLAAILACAIVWLQTAQADASSPLEPEGVFVSTQPPTPGTTSAWEAAGIAESVAALKSGPDFPDVPLIVLVATDHEDTADEDTHVTVFVGAHQHRLPFDLVAAMQALGARGRYIKLRHIGKNLLDFHLAFHLGELVARNPEATYRIVSEDGGFDALIEDFQARDLAVERLRVEPAPTGSVHEQEDHPTSGGTTAP
ncbi:MAG: hypothetical protein KFB96_22055 [Thiocapsa sp.]|uniref:PIN domain-containing protein n=1 Tax=Thiocapsa sp. TaxID=2024551 RepID=UPI001BCA6A1A|nr:PIN domain-containing protein [Thiocapsa sp.]QVL48274.1 MAG: hypothetical protein KFB96_22055 [Thiocapsa sp.]